MHADAHPAGREVGEQDQPLVVVPAPLRLPVDEVAQSAGCGTAGSMRLYLQAEIGTSPTAYRCTFRPRDGVQPGRRGPAVRPDDYRPPT